MSTTSLSVWCDSIKVAVQAVVDTKEALRECQTAARQAESALDRANKKIDQTRQALLPITCIFLKGQPILTNFMFFLQLEKLSYICPPTDILF